jgi:hypothetical protein
MNKKLNILFACDMNESRPWFRDRIPGINKAIENTSYIVKMVDIYSLLGEHEWMPTHLSQRKLFLQNTNLLEANKNFEDGVISLMPKVLILGTADNYHQFLMPRTVRNIRSKGIFVAGILGDDEFNFPVYKFLLGWFDLFIAYVKPCVNYYEKFNLSKGYFFPNSCYLNNKAFDKYSQDTEYDAIIVGAPSANRAEMVKALIDDGLNVAIYGSKQWESYDFAKKYYYGFIPTENFDKVLSKGKIVLAFLEDHISGNLHMNTKIWEAVRVARLPIATYYEPLEKDYGLVEGVSIVTYKNTKELVEKVRYYADNDSARFKIVKNLYHKIEREFDYAAMYENLFHKLMKLSNENKISGMKFIDIESFIERSDSIQYFKSSSSYLDDEVVNILSITDSYSFDYIYFNSIENSKRVINRWPFINFNSIIFLTKQKTKVSYFIVFFKAFLLKRTLHVSQFCVITDKETIVGRVNRGLDKMINTNVGVSIKKLLKKVNT